jgi:hypothetical protein
LTAARRRDVFGKPVAKRRELEPDTLASDAQKRVDPDARLRTEIRVADFERVRREVRPVGIELVEVRSPVRATEAGTDADALAHGVEESQGAGQGVERAGACGDSLIPDVNECRLPRHVLGEVVPGAGLESDGATPDLLDNESRQRVIVR